jgi:hypothetical protein
MPQSSTGFRVEARAREVVALPRRAERHGVRTRSCPLCGERVGATKNPISMRRRAGALALFGAVTYAGFVGLSAFGAEWLWYHTDRIGRDDFASALTLLEAWPLTLPLAAVAVYFLWRAAGPKLVLDAATCTGCARDERRARRRRTQLTAAVGFGAAVVGVIGLWLLKMPALWGVVVSAPVAFAAALAANRLWPPAITWLGAHRGDLILEVSPSFARVLIDEGRGVVRRASRPGASRAAMPAALLTIGVVSFALTGDQPVCPVDTTPTRSVLDDGVVERTCIDDEGRMHGRFIRRGPSGRIVALGGAHNGVASGWWLVDGEVIDGFDVEKERHELVAR